jgi:hypothetical protein
MIPKLRTSDYYIISPKNSFVDATTPYNKIVVESVHK